VHALALEPFFAKVATVLSNRPVAIPKLLIGDRTELPERLLILLRVKVGVVFEAGGDERAIVGLRSKDESAIAPFKPASVRVGGSAHANGQARILSPTKA